MKAFKKFLKSDGFKTFVSWIAAGYIWLVYRTSRWQVLNGDLPHQYMKEGRPFIITFWHGRLLMMSISVKRKTKVNALISHHSDGEMIAKTIKHWGQKSIRGSSSNGALAAIKEMLRAIKQQEVVAITPDGPRGPRMRAQEGVVRIAAMSGVPVFPTSYSTTRGRLLNSWDRFFVAKPFSKGVIIWGDPIEVPRQDKNGAYETARQKIEDSLTILTHTADEICQQIRVEPEDISAPPKSRKKTG